MWRASMNDIQSFCRVAFDSYGSLLMPLMREIEYHTSTSFRFGNTQHEERALRRTDRTFVILENLLRAQALKEDREYRLWDGNVDVVRQKRWYLDYESSEHLRIVKAYFASLSALPTGDDMAVFLRVDATFPGVAPSFDSLWSMGHADAMGFAVRENNFLNLPGKLFSTEYPDKRVYNAALAHFGKYCREWAASGDMFALDHLADIAAAVKIPLSVIRLDPFMDLLNATRWTILKGLNDEQFLLRFSRDGKFKIGRFGSGAGEDGVGQGLRDYVLERGRQIAA